MFGNLNKVQSGLNHWLGNVSMKLKDNNKKKIGNFISWFPYILLAFILILSRTNDNLNKLLKSVNLNFLNIFGEEKINAIFHLLYSPGSVLLFVSLTTFLIHKMNFRQINNSFRDSTKIIFWGWFCSFIYRAISQNYDKLRYKL